jgi:glycosyltransferase involved in cell wall biosynthesis
MVCGGGDLDHELTQMGAIVDCCGIEKKKWRIKAPFWCLWLRGYLREHKINAVIEHCCLEGYVSWACASVGVPYMVSVIHSTYKLGFRHRLQRRLSNRIFLRRYSHFVAVSESVRKHEAENFGVPFNRIEVIPNGIVLDRFQLPVLTLRKRRQLLGVRLEEDEIVVGIVGRLVEAKNHEFLLNVWSKLVTELAVRIRLVIVGDGVLRETLEQQRDSLGLRDSVLFLGMRTDIPRLLKSFDIFVMSSKHEGHPIVALEAMAAGLPVVATNVAGLRDVIQDGVNGFLVDAENPEAFAEGLEKLIFDVDLRCSMGRTGRRYVEKHFSIERCGRLYEKSLLESPLNKYNKYTRG